MKNDKQYTLEMILKAFSEHAKIYEDDFQEKLAMVKKGEIDGTFYNEKDYFNLPKALCCIIKEIIELKKY